VALLLAVMLMNLLDEVLKRFSVLIGVGFVAIEQFDFFISPRPLLDPEMLWMNRVVAVVVVQNGV
jgi:hypothetical protein